MPSGAGLFTRLSGGRGWVGAAGAGDICDPGTTAVDAGHMLLPQRLLAPFLPRWARAHTGSLEHARI